MYPELLKNYDIILASKSPRRKELLAQAGIPFRVVARETSEHFTSDSDPAEVVLTLCQRKAALFDSELSNEHIVVIAADTIVVCQGEIINKPANEAEAFSMLTGLSGKSHDVLTGVCIRHKEDSLTFFEKTRVHFRMLKEDEILHYINTSRPFDKAGGYGIQEWIGYIGITGIEGSYSNVVGLPVHRVYEELIRLLDYSKG